MTVYEYRKANPHCKYCKHSLWDVFANYCKAKCEHFIFNCAEKCPLYEPERMKGEKVE